MTTDEMLQWQKIPLGDRALQVLDKIHSEKIMITSDLYNNHCNLFSFKTVESIRALPVWQNARLGEIVKALFKRGYLEKVKPDHRYSLKDYVSQLKEQMKVLDSSISCSFYSGHNGFTVKFPAINLHRVFDLRDDYFSFISPAGIQALLDSQERLKVIEEKTVKNRNG